MRNCRLINFVWRCDSHLKTLLLHLPLLEFALSRRTRCICHETREKGKIDGARWWTRGVALLRLGLFFFVISMTIRVQTHVKLAELTTRFGFTCTPQLTRQINIVEDGLMALGEKRLGTCHCVWSVWWSLLVHYANIVAIDLEEMNFYLEYNLCKNRRDYVHHLVSPDRRGQPPTLRYCMRWKIQSGQPNRLMNNKS